MNGHAGSFHVLSVQVPTKLAALSLRLRQYKLVAQIQVEPQHELTFAVGSQGVLSDGVPSAAKQFLNSSPVATRVMNRSGRTNDMNRRSIVIRNGMKKIVPQTQKNMKLANVFTSGGMNMAGGPTMGQPQIHLGSFTALSMFKGYWYGLLT